MSTFMRTTVLAFLLLATSVFAEDQPANTQDNLLVNPSFEQPGGKNPRGWHVQAANPHYITDGVEGETVRTGKAAIRLSSPTDLHQRWVANNNTRPPVEGGQAYTFSVWVKVEHLEEGEYVQLRFEMFDADGNTLPPGGGSAWVAGERHRPANGEWVQISDTLTTNPDARMVRPLLVLASNRENSNAVATFDDASLVQVSAE